MHPVAEQYRGFVLAEREQNLRDDSYFWLTVWNPDEVRSEQFQYAATAYGGCGPMSSHLVTDLLAATPAGVRFAAERQADQAGRAAAINALGVEMSHGHVFKGDIVRVTRGRKVPRGTEGRVLGVEDRVTHVSRYGTWATHEQFALIDTPTGFWSVNAKHLDVVRRGEVMQRLFDLAN